MVTKTNPKYDLVIKRLHLYYDMNLVSFSIDNNSDLIIQFPVFMQPYSQSPHKLYQIEVPAPIINQNVHPISCTEIHI